MSAIALVGSLTLVLHENTLNKILLPLVAFAAGSLIGGAVFHMLPASVEHFGNEIFLYVWLMSGFVLFFVLEQFMHWHHSHDPVEQRKQPLTYLILIADGLHNLIGGLSVGAAFIIDIRLGIVTWLVAAAHEVPQELGDFAVLVHGGWKKSNALIYNFLSALTFPLGGLIAYTVSAQIDVALLIPFAAGNFIYIGAADLIPEIKQATDVRTNIVHLLSFISGLVLLLIIRLLIQGSS
ncbi:Zinc transporter ZupT [Gimesia algae]|uniref:Zinc transporter ZupT n=2 Tax=Gimesia algae TaxID=2527971 RepID=A0A517VA71_9PLAN|nr:Zinc transporter ZupT [Gimesia algae]